VVNVFICDMTTSWWLRPSQGADYFYMVNDDLMLVTPRWADSFVHALRNSPIAPNLGVAGKRVLRGAVKVFFDIRHSQARSFFCMRASMQNYPCKRAQLHMQHTATNDPNDPKSLHAV